MQPYSPVSRVLLYQSFHCLRKIAIVLFFVSPTVLFASSVGERAISSFITSKSSERAPGGDCYNVAYDRLKNAFSIECNISLPDLRGFESFDRLWASKFDPASTWKKLPAHYRAKGAPGALASIGVADLVDADGIWNGELKTGAVLQTWQTVSDYELVKEGKAPLGFGHSFLFVSYVRANGKIVGMKIADQGNTAWSYPSVVGSSDFAYWVGGNLKCSD